MKKTQQILVTIISLIILTFFVGTSWADVCEGDYTIDATDTSGDITALSDCTEITGSLSIQNTALTNLTGLENLTTVGGDLFITSNALTSLNGLNSLTTLGGGVSVSNNDALTTLSGLSNITTLSGDLTISSNDLLASLTGLNNLTNVSGNVGVLSNNALADLSGLTNITSVGGSLLIGTNSALSSLDGLDNIAGMGGDLGIYNNPSLTNLCALYSVNLGNNALYITYNTALSMDTALALETQLRSNGFTGTADIHDNNGSGLVSCDNDTDEDGVPDNTDNCPNDFNAEQLDADTDGTGDVCDEFPGCGGCGDPICEKTLTEKVEELLTHYYWNILNRAPDPGGLDYWTGVILDIVSSGGDIKEGFISFAEFFFNSGEYLGRDRDDTEFVTDLYNTFFNRPPESGGLAYWLEKLICCLSRDAVLDYFVNSTEFNTFMDDLFFGTS